MFRAIAAPNFPPFGELYLRFPPIENKPSELAEVHLFTGINGTGKSRILSILAAMLGNFAPLQQKLSGSDGDFTLLTTGEPDLAPPVGNDGESSAPIHLWRDRFRASPGNSGCVGQGNMAKWMQAVPAFAYSGTAYVRDEAIAVMQTVPRLDRTRCLSFLRPTDQSKELIQAIANLKLEAAMDSMDRDSEEHSPTHAARLVEALEKALSNITGRRLRFSVKTIPKLSLEVNWEGTRLPVDALPDGLRSIVGWLAHAVVMMDIYLGRTADPLQTEAVFLLDEIEAHLHPAWQRRILPAFQRLFPKSQIFIASHSPFLISSLNHGWIHPLSVSAGGRVKISPAIAASQGDSYLSVLEEIMGLTELYDPETEEQLACFRAARDRAYGGDWNAVTEAREIGTRLAQRSTELSFMMGKELSQLDRQIAKATSAR